MSKKIAVWLALAMSAFLVQVPTATQVAGAYAPAEGAVFNVPAPWGTAEQRNRIINKVNAAIEHAAPGSTVLVATYLFDRRKSVEALIAACRNGASVRVLLDGNIATSASARLAQTLNGDNVDDDGPNTGACGEGAPVPGETPDPLTQGDVPESVTAVDGSRPSWGADRSYVAKCNRACRGDGSSMHGKFYVFSQTGEKSNVIMVSSSNLNAGGASRGWNDLYTHYGSAGHFQRYREVHEEMTDENRVRAGEGPSYNYDDGPVLSRFFPWTGAGKAQDPVLHDLNKVRCTGSPLGRTSVHVSQFWIKGDRGNYVVDKLLSLARAKCQVSIIYGAPSVEIATRLRAAARSGLINVYDSRWWFDKDPEVDVRTHAKYVLVKGSYGGDPSSWQVMTSTANWNPGSLARGDENSMNISGASAWRDYIANWNVIRKHSKRVPFRR